MSKSKPTPATDWEIPTHEIETDEIVEVIEAADELEIALESPESPVETTATVERPRTYIVKAGDSYASIAKTHTPKGVKSFDYAKDLHAVNAGKALRPGLEILL